MKFKNIQNEIIYNIVNTPVFTWPWPHMVYKDIFPKNFYDLIMKFLPSENEITGVIKNKNDDNYQNGRNILSDEDIQKIDHNKTKFWKNFKVMMQDGELKLCILDKIKPLLIDHYGKNYFSHFKFEDTFQLTLDKPGFVLSPHTDTFNKVFTIVFNLVNTNSNENDTTIIHKGPVVTNEDCDQNVNLEEISECKRVGHKPNTGVGIFQTLNSWHSVGEVKENRWTIQYTIWAKPKNDT